MPELIWTEDEPAVTEYHAAIEPTTEDTEYQVPGLSAREAAIEVHSAIVESVMVEVPA